MTIDRAKELGITLKGNYHLDIEVLLKEVERGQRMLLAACMDLGAIGNALNADMNADGDELLGMVNELKADNDALRTKADCVDDCAHLIRKLVHCRRQLATDGSLAEKALDYLKRKGLQGSPLRAEECGHD